MRRRLRWVSAVFAGTGLLSCGPAQTDEPADQQVAEATAFAGCLQVPAGRFVNTAIGTQAGRFDVELWATPGANDTDYVIGLSNGAATSFSNLAVAVRFNPQGFIDARDAGTYRASEVIPYQGGERYRVTFQVDMHRRRYSAWVLLPDGNARLVAQDFAFRTGHENAIQLTQLAARVDQAGGSGSLCDVNVYGESCHVVSAGSGWFNQARWPQPGVAVLSFSARPSIANIDAVIGMSSGAADAFTDLGSIVRFNSSGFIDARNGSSYTSLIPAPYVAGNSYTFFVTIDVRSRQFSVDVIGPQGSYKIAERFAFRTEQNMATVVDNVAAKVDSAAGSVALCSINVQNRDRTLWIVPPVAGQVVTGPNNRVYVAMPDWLTVFDTATGRTVADMMRGGRVAIDSAGNVILAGTFSGTYDAGGGIVLNSAGGNDVYVTKYTPSLVPIWSRRLGAAGNEWLADIAVDGANRILLTGTTIGTQSLDANGNPLWARSEVATDIAADRNGNVALVLPLFADNRGARVLALDNAGRLRWERTFADADHVAQVALDNAGNVLVAGEFWGIVNFGGADLYHQSSDTGGIGYLLKLNAAGGHVWSQIIDQVGLRELAVDRTDNVSIAGMSPLSPREGRVRKVAANGSELWSQTNPAHTTSHGLATDVAGNVYWSLVYHELRDGRDYPALYKLAP